mmetsp:Transcript_5703/g.11613  ORF Transcript_5703/g.11613 Transcript_5703/m.11613 type:complete len:193 (-) Transcript_5703:80-658(-)
MAKDAAESRSTLYAEGTAAVSDKKHKKIPVEPLQPGDRKFTLEQLNAFSAEAPGSQQILLSVLGRVYDVSTGRKVYGSGGKYSLFAGHDGTYNLAVMTMKKNTLDMFEYELDDEDKCTLSEWIAFFDHRYGRPLGELVDRRHAVHWKDLPRPSKIPFSGDDDDEEEAGGNAALDAGGLAGKDAAGSPKRSRL